MQQEMGEAEVAGAAARVQRFLTVRFVSAVRRQVLLSALWAFLETLLVLLLLGLAGAAAVLYYDPKIRRAVRIAETYPQPSSLPIIGHLLHILKPRGEF